MLLAAPGDRNAWKPNKLCKHQIFFPVAVRKEIGSRFRFYQVSRLTEGKISTLIWKAIAFQQWDNADALQPFSMDSIFGLVSHRPDSDNSHSTGVVLATSVTLCVTPNSCSVHRYDKSKDVRSGKNADAGSQWFPVSLFHLDSTESLTC